MSSDIIQFGEGNFLRGFVDYFIFKLREKGLFDGTVTVVQPISRGLIPVLNEQGGKYNLFLRGIENGEVKTEHSYIDVIKQGIDPYTDFEGYLALADNPSYRFIVSNTTEAGIAFDPACKPCDAPALSYPGKLTQLLYRRYKNGLAGFIILACELIDNNGKELKRCVLQYAKLWELEDSFIKWIEDENTFSDTLVDRIVTGFPSDEADALAPGDKLLDTAEIFHLWVIEGDFEDELPLKKAGFNVIWTNDVTPYKKRKVRILNGSHTSMVAGALLAGVQTVGECMADGDVRAFLNRCLFEEILPTIGASEDNMRFASDVLDRFSNPFIKHQLRSIALNSVSKFSVRVLPTMLEYKDNNGEYPQALTMSLALLIQLYKSDAPQDVPEVAELMKNGTVREILSSDTLWGQDISALTEQTQANLELIRSSGARAAIKSVV